MGNDLTMGRYFAANSAVHRLDPRTKLFGTLLFIVSLFLIRNNLTYALCLGLILLAYRAARVPLRYLLRGMRGIAVLLVFTFIFRTFFSPGAPLWSWGILHLTRAGLHLAVRLVARISLMILAASLLSYTTTPRQLSDGMEKALSGLKRFDVPLDDLALIVTITFRFIPVLNDEARAMMDAQAARGVDFQRSGPLGRMCRMPTLVIPLFVSVLRRSADLATAMEARGYSGDNRATKLHPLEYGPGDRTVYFLFLAYIPLAFLADRLTSALT